MTRIHTRIQGMLSNGKAGNYAKYEYMCLAVWPQYLKARPKCKFAKFEYDPTPIYQGDQCRQVQMSEDQQLKWILGCSRMWHIGELFKDPEKIVAEKGLTFNLDEINGFDFYTAVSILRNIESYGTFMAQKDAFDFDRFAEGEDGPLYWMKYSIEGKNAMAIPDGHSIWNGNDGTLPEAYKFNSLISRPKQVSIRENPYWNIDKDGRDFRIMRAYSAGNTR